MNSPLQHDAMTFRPLRCAAARTLYEVLPRTARNSEGPATPTFILSHGLGGNLESMHPLMHALASRLPSSRILSLSLPHHNGSEDVGAWTLEALSSQWTAVLEEEGVLGDERRIVPLPSAFTAYVWLHAMQQRAPLAAGVQKLISIDWMAHAKDHMTDPMRIPTSATWHDYRDGMVKLLKQGGNAAVAKHVDETIAVADELQITKSHGFVRDSVLRLGHPVDAMARASEATGAEILYVTPLPGPFPCLEVLNLGGDSKFVELEAPGELAEAALAFVTR